jgi:3-dehydroquinate synthase II
VGSTSQGFFLVAAETLENPYVKPRPFRVNAGAVHCYLLNGETTLYLSEAQAGHRIEAVQRNGHRRTVVLGRSKTERRPLLLIEAEAQGRRHSVMLQNAETVRLMRPRGRPLSVSRLAPGDKVLMRLETAARHFGMKIQEQLEET